MATISNKENVTVPTLFEDKGKEEDEVVFRFEQSTEKNECFMSLSEYRHGIQSNRTSHQRYYGSTVVYGQQKELNELYVSKAFLCLVSPVFKAMFNPDSKFEESQYEVRICDFPRMSNLAFFRMIHPNTFQLPSGN